MKSCQQDVLIDSSVSGNELSVFSFWQQIVGANFEFSAFEFSETVSSFLVGAINMASVEP
jgi:hypothetical protein